MAIFDTIGEFLGGGKSAGKAMPYYDRAMAMEKDYLDPFINRGQRAGDYLENQLASEYGRLMKDPGAFLSQWMEGYNVSPYAKMMQDKLGTAISNTAAAGGMRGSPMESGQQAEMVQGLLSKDMGDYLDRAMRLYTTGLGGETGLQSHLYDTAFEGARSLAGDLSNLLGQEGQLEFQGQRDKEKMGQDFISSLISAAGAFFGGR